MALPWDEVNAEDSMEVAEFLGLPKASEARKFGGCPGCGSSDALHAYPFDSKHSGGFICWGGCSKQFYSNVDLAAAVWGCPAFEACVRLAQRFGITVTDDPPPTGQDGTDPKAFIAKRRHRSVDEENRAALEALPGARYPHQIYAELTRRLTLTPRARAFLAARRIDPDLAFEYGFRSIDDRDGWDRLSAYLLKTYRTAELKAAGFPPFTAKELEKRNLPPETKKLHLPWGGYLPYMFMPYWHDGKMVATRVCYYGPDRNEKSAPPKYLTLREAGIPLMPFGADSFGDSYLHVIEGELNAFVLMMRPYRERAISTASAHYWRDEWTPLLLQSKRIIAWYDPDKAGDLGFEALRNRIVAAIGEDEAERRIFRMAESADPNDRHIDNTLKTLLREAPWMPCAI